MSLQRPQEANPLDQTFILETPPPPRRLEITILETLEYCERDSRILSADSMDSVSTLRHLTTFLSSSVKMSTTKGFVSGRRPELLKGLLRVVHVVTEHGVVNLDPLERFGELDEKLPVGLQELGVGGHVEEHPVS